MTHRLRRLALPVAAAVLASAAGLFLALAPDGGRPAPDARPLGPASPATRARPPLAFPAAGPVRSSAPLPTPATTQAELQAQLDSAEGTAYLASVIELTSPLRLRAGTQTGGTTYPSRPVRLIGLDPTRAKLRAAVGSTVSPLLDIGAGTWESRLEDFALEGSGQQGTGITVGVGKRPGDGNGTNTGSQTWRNLSVSGFAIGVQIGDAAQQTSASEVTFERLKVADCASGVLITGAGDSLNFRFPQLLAADCRCVVGIASGGSVHIDGGSFSGCGYTAADPNQEPVACLQMFWADTVTVRNLRCENRAGPFFRGSQGGNYLTAILDGVSDLGARPAPHPELGVRSNDWFAYGQYSTRLLVRGCTSDTGRVHLASTPDPGYGCHATIDGCLLGGAKGPLTWNAGTAATYDVRSTARFGAGNVAVAPYGVTRSGRTDAVAGATSLATSRVTTSIAGRVVTTEVIAYDGWGAERADNPPVSVTHRKDGTGPAVPAAVTRPDPAGRPGRYVATYTLPSGWAAAGTATAVTVP